MAPNESDPVQRYLDELQRELRWRRVAASEAALSDAREFLECEREQLRQEGAAMNASETLAHFVRVFGAPSSIATSYSTTAREGKDAKPISAKPINGRWLQVGVLVAVMLGGMAGLCVASFLQEPPKLSPFTSVRHAGEKTIVRFRDKEFELLTLDDVPTEKILRASKDHFGDRWQKRFAEDLVEVLWAMKHRPGSTVKLELRELDSGKTRTVADAAMTEANRSAVWLARNENAMRKAQGVSPAHLNALVGLFKTILQERWSYYSHSAPAIDASIDEFDDVSQPTDTAELALQLQEVIAQGIDGHAEVTGWELEPGYLPFLIERSGNRYVAIRPGRDGFLADEYPYITSIDGRPMADWLERAKSLVPKSSTGYIERHALRRLRNIQHWRDELGLPQDIPLRVDLMSEDGRVKAVIGLQVAAGMPVYGVWPRTESRVLSENIGYLRLPSMNAAAVDEIKHRMKEFRKTNGLIVDVRDNGGGSRDALRWLASYLMDEDDPPRVVNCAKYRLYDGFEDEHLASRYLYRADAPEWTAAERDAIDKFRSAFKPEWQPPGALFSDWHFMVLSRLDDPAMYHYSKPVVVLMNTKCFSATDVFLAALKGWPNVTLLGTASGGGSAKAETYRLGDTPIHVRLGSMISFTPAGILFDKHGVQPDVIKEPEPGYFINRSDKTLDGAIKLIQRR